MATNKSLIQPDAVNLNDNPGCAEYARRWLSQASGDDLVRVSRLLKVMCEHCQDDEDYDWSVRQVRRITGYTSSDPEDYQAFDAALREGLRKLAGHIPELNVCPSYRPGKQAP